MVKYKYDILLVKLKNEEWMKMPNVTCSNCGTEFDSKEIKCPSCGMKNRLKICHVCGAQMAKNAKRCPKCGAKNRKPIYKRWWFWVSVLCIVFIAFINIKEVNLGTEISNNQTQEKEARDEIIGEWYPYRYLDRKEEELKDASVLDSKIIAKDDYTFEINIDEQTYCFTWAFFKEDGDGRYYNLTTADGQSLFAAIVKEDSEITKGTELFDNSLVIFLEENGGMICRRES